jgi:hypothetical protein
MPETTVPAVKTNPLLSILRQPKIYIKLPSGGKYYPEGSINISVTGEYPVYSMTAKDELTFKTPDALMNGQALVDVIQSCMPNIINAWEIPQIDLDCMLCAIRLATYGSTMTLNITHPAMEESSDYEVDLHNVLDSLQNVIQWEDRFEVSPELVVYIKPLNYKAQAEAQISEFDTQRLVAVVRDENLSEEDKLTAFKSAFNKLSQKTISIVGKAIYKIESTAGVVEETEFIQEFIEKCDSAIFEKIKDRLGLLNSANKLKPLSIASTPEMLEKGAPEFIEVPFTFDESNFFG